MKKMIEREADDEPRSEYDLEKLRVRKVGPGRRRREIIRKAKAGAEEMRRGELKSLSNIDELIDSLTND